MSSGTWDASNHYLTCTASEGEIYRTNSDGSSDLWFSYYDGDTSSAAYYETSRDSNQFLPDLFISEYS